MPHEGRSRESANAFNPESLIQNPYAKTMQESIDYLKRQQERESNARSYPRRIPLAIKEAKGIYLTDTNGKTYFDCLAAAGTMALGHNHPVVVEALQAAVTSNLPWQTLDITTPTKDEFVEEIWQSLPQSLPNTPRFNSVAQAVPMLQKPPSNW